MKERLEGLQGRIPGLLRAEVGIDFGRGSQSLDVALCAEFDTRESLASYQDHPEHLAVVQFIRKIRDQRVVVDFET
jgi:hypothetical protein